MHRVHTNGACSSPACHMSSLIWMASRLAAATSDVKGWWALPLKFSSPGFRGPTPSAWSTTRSISWHLLKPMM
jgi:hypothetical protein